MIGYMKNGVRLQVGQAFDGGGKSFPANWLELASLEDLAAESITVIVLPDPSPPKPAGPATFFFAQDLLQQLTDAEFGQIQTAISGNNRLLGMWYSLLAQRDPMEVNKPRVIAGWKGLANILGAARMTAIAAALGIVEPA